MAHVTEVDLHTAAFLRNTSGLYPEDLVRHSIDRMRQALKQAIQRGDKEIRFIHGQGSGALKERVYHELRVCQKDGLIESFEPAFFNKGVVNVIIRF